MEEIILLDRSSYFASWEEKVCDKVLPKYIFHERIPLSFLAWFSNIMIFVSLIASFPVLRKIYKYWKRDCNPAEESYIVIGIQIFSSFMWMLFGFISRKLSTVLFSLLNFSISCYILFVILTWEKRR